MTRTRHVTFRRGNACFFDMLPFYRHCSSCHNILHCMKNICVYPLTASHLFWQTARYRQNGSWQRAGFIPRRPEVQVLLPQPRTKTNRIMKLQRHAISQQTTGRIGLSCRFASLASLRGALKPMNLSTTCWHLPSLAYGYGRESDSRQSGRMTV